MTPRFGTNVCPSCRFIGSFEGVDWYVCKGGQSAQIVGRFSSFAHDYRVRRVMDIKSGGPWKRAKLLAIGAGLL